MTTRRLWTLSSALALTLLLVSGSGVFSQAETGSASQAFSAYSRAYTEFRAGHLDQAETLLRQAMSLAPAWAAPHGLLGVIYQERSFASEDNGDNDANKQRALHEYEIVQAAVWHTISTAPANPPWIDGPNLIAPARGIVGGGPANLARAMQALARPEGNRLQPVSSSNSPRATGGRASTPHLGKALNPLPPGCVRTTDTDLSKALKDLRSLTALCDATTIWRVNDVRLQSERPALVPDAVLGLMARSFGIWLWDNNVFRHQWLGERFQRAFPNVCNQWDIKETLSCSISRLGAYNLAVSDVTQTVDRLFRSPGHAEALLDPNMEFIGPAVVASHSGSYVVQIELVGPPPKPHVIVTRAPGGE